MTAQEARRRARGRWSFGSIKRITWSPHAGYQVGIVSGFGWTKVFEAVGKGDSWESAFVDADERIRKFGGVRQAVASHWQRRPGRG